MKSQNRYCHYCKKMLMCVHEPEESGFVATPSVSCECPLDKTAHIVFHSGKYSVHQDCFIDAIDKVIENG